MEHYESAAIRHFTDAEQLKDLGKLDNAGHLIGFAAECAIKHHISAYGQGCPHGHFPEFLIIARKRLTQRSSVYQMIKQDILVGWNVNHRYFQTGNTTQVQLDTWFREATRLFAKANLKVHK